MRARALVLGLTLAACSGELAADEQSPSAVPGEQPATQPSAADERVVLSGNGSTLSQNHGGGGGSATWLSNVGSGGVVGVGAEYQTVANSHWTTGALSGSLKPGLRTSIYGEVHEGAGDTGTHAFHYSLLAAGAFVALTSRFSVQLEERRIDIDTSHGNLPKLGLSLGVTPRLQASVAYAYSVGGNLGTKLATARVDYVSKSFSWLAGAARGPVAPSVLNLLGQVLEPAPTLTEGFAGLGKPIGRTEWKLLGDYQDLAGFKRTTITLACTVHLTGGS